MLLKTLRKEQEKHLSLLKEKYIQLLQQNPTLTNRKIGIELEFPIIEIGGNLPCFQFLKKLLKIFVNKHSSFYPIEYDTFGNPIKIKHIESKDMISYESTYGMLEFNLAPRKSIFSLQIKVEEYLRQFQEILFQKHLCLFSAGLNPYSHSLLYPWVQNAYYQMLQHFFTQFNLKKIYSLSNYNILISSSQIHLDVSSLELASTLNVINALGWVKALLFANSADIGHYIDKKDCLCTRDLLWHHCTLAYHPQNVGIRDHFYSSIDDVLMSTLQNSQIFVNRKGSLIYFQPLIVSEFLKKSIILGYKVEQDDSKSQVIIEPELHDIWFSRPYNDAVITSKGTIEIRSECQQPFSDLLTPSAFHLGLISNLSAINEYTQIIGQYINFSNFSYWRRKAIWKGYHIQDDLPFSITQFIEKILLLIKTGLEKRGLGEEIFLDPLFKRLEMKMNPAIELMQIVKTQSIKKAINSFTSKEI